MENFVVIALAMIMNPCEEAITVPEVPLCRPWCTCSVLMPHCSLSGAREMALYGINSAIERRSFATACRFGDEHETERMMH
jgi:hypothetical protein